jgi:hypothetical protein
MRKSGLLVIALIVCALTMIDSTNRIFAVVGAALTGAEAPATDLVLVKKKPRPDDESPKERKRRQK